MSNQITIRCKNNNKLIDVELEFYFVLILFMIFLKMKNIKIIGGEFLVLEMIN